MQNKDLGLEMLQSTILTLMHMMRVTTCLVEAVMHNDELCGGDKQLHES